MYYHVGQNTVRLTYCHLGPSFTSLSLPECCIEAFDAEHVLHRLQLVFSRSVAFTYAYMLIYGYSYKGIVL